MDPHEARPISGRQIEQRKKNDNTLFEKSSWTRGSRGVVGGIIYLKKSERTALDYVPGICVL